MLEQLVENTGQVINNTAAVSEHVRRIGGPSAVARDRCLQFAMARLEEAQLWMLKANQVRDPVIVLPG